MLYTDLRLVSALLVGLLQQASAQFNLDLGTAASFGVIGGQTVTSTGPTNITGSLGLYPGTSVTGFPPGSADAIYAADSVSQQALADAQAAYDAAAARPTTGQLPGSDLGGERLVAGTYTAPAAVGITGTLTLDGENDPNALFVFQIGSSLTAATGSTVQLINGARACNVFWQVGSSATLLTTTAFNGNILALTSISLQDGASVTGGVFALNGAVTLINNQIIRPGACEATTTSSTSSFTTEDVRTTPTNGITTEDVVTLIDETTTTATLSNPTGTTIEDVAATSTSEITTEDGGTSTYTLTTTEDVTATSTSESTTEDGGTSTYTLTTTEDVGTPTNTPTTTEDVVSSTGDSTTITFSIPEESTTESIVTTSTDAPASITLDTTTEPTTSLSSTTDSTTTTIGTTSVPNTSSSTSPPTILSSTFLPTALLSSTTDSPTTTTIGTTTEPTTLSLTSRPTISSSTSRPTISSSTSHPTTLLSSTSRPTTTVRTILAVSVSAIVGAPITTVLPTAYKTILPNGEISVTFPGKEIFNLLWSLFGLA